MSKKINKTERSPKEIAEDLRQMKVCTHDCENCEYAAACTSPMFVTAADLIEAMDKDIAALTGVIESQKASLDKIAQLPAPDAAKEILSQLDMCIEQKCDNCPRGYTTTYERGCVCVMQEIKAAMLKQAERIAELEEQLRWTPVTGQSLPDEFVSVLVNIPSDDPLPTVKEAYLVDDVWVTKTSHYTKHEITHWRTMPKGPEVRSE